MPINKLNREAVAGGQAQPARGRPLQELLRPRPGLLALRAAAGADAALDPRQVRQEARRAGGEHAHAQGRLQLRRDDRDCCRSTTACRRRRSRRARYRKITGNEAIGDGPGRGRHARRQCRWSTPATRSRRPATSCTQLAELKRFGVRTIQAEDEIAAIGVAIGAAFGGRARRHRHQRPRHLPEVRGDRPGRDDRAAAASSSTCSAAAPAPACRPRPSRPTCLQAMFGRNGECPVAIVAPCSPADCFDMAFEAVRIATEFMTPVFLLSDGYLANGAEPWPIPESQTCRRSRSSTRPDPTATATASAHFCRTSATSGWCGRGRFPARRAWSTASAAWRRKTSPATSATTRPTTSTWSRRGPRRSPTSPTTFRDLSVERPRAGRPAGHRLGRHLRRDRDGRAAGPAQGPEGGPRPPALPEPDAEEHRRRCSSATRRCWCRS